MKRILCAAMVLSAGPAFAVDNMATSMTMVPTTSTAVQLIPARTGRAELQIYAPNGYQYACQFSQTNNFSMKSGYQFSPDYYNGFKMTMTGYTGGLYVMCSNPGGVSAICLQVRELY